MRRPLFFFLALILTATLDLASAQQISVVRVGVVAEDSRRSGMTPNASESAIRQRDLLVNYLNQQKPGKRNPVKVEAMPINTAADSYLFIEAQHKNCEYLVRLHIGSAELSNQDVPQAVSYSILKVGDGKPVSTPTFALLPRDQTAMVLMGSVYDAIVKAAKP
jgi:hypothetical protein